MNCSLRSGKQHELSLYSFATKYAHFHHENVYPIFDNLVKGLMSEINRKFRFHEPFTHVLGSFVVGLDSKGADTRS